MITPLLLLICSFTTPKTSITSEEITELLRKNNTEMKLRECQFYQAGLEASDIFLCLRRLRIISD